LSATAQRELRHPRDQARYLLRLALGLVDHPHENANRGAMDSDWLPVELMLKAMRDQYESHRAPQDVMTSALFERVIGALRVAMQMAEVADDWNLDEVEIDGEMWRTWDIRNQMRTLLADLGRSQEDE